MFRLRKNRSIGRWSALLAAYAFVLNALLATTLLAATPPAKSLSGFELCTSSDAASSQLDQNDKATKRAAVHCQICLQYAAPVGLPAPSDLSLPLPLSGSSTVAFVSDQIWEHNSGTSPHAPRGPPHLG